MLGTLLFIPAFSKMSDIKFNREIKFGIKFYAFWLIYGTITLLWSVDPVVGLNSEIIAMFLGMISLIIFPVFLKNDEKSLKTIRNAWILGLACTLPIAFYEISTMQHFSYDEEERLLGGLGVYAPFASIFFGNYNNYCVYICFCFPFLFWALVETPSKIWKVIYGSFIGAGILIIFINTNRTSLVVVALYLLCFIRFKVKSVLTIVGVFFLVIVLYNYLPASLRSTLDMLYNYRVNVDYSEDTSSKLREGVFKEGVRFLKDSGGFGSGAGSFEELMLRSPKYDGISNPHNLFLEIFAQYGVIVFGLFIYWFWLILKKINKNTSLNGYSKRILMMGVFAIPVIGIINSAALGYTIWWIYFSSLVMIASIDFKAEKLEV
ncbi:O-antigen ligase family protein [Chryseobacterium sp. L7]|uniref:O-antigen ligase family protein n=1 Tax=Chryseobacterium endalhagicum TaxID=2797638 RepID=A0ABS1QB45_9FLAO|nr:O-antigen ligase family protein [Chryseobacterium endalhagicum]MBL1219832.1 O-antigen ligase family protein [Chryseobacterium endalhagicum]